MGKKLSRIITLPSRMREAALRLTASYEPDLSSEAGAADFLLRLKGVTTPSAPEPAFRALLKLTGHRYYAFYAGLMTIILVIVIFPLLAYLPLGARDAMWTVLSAANTVITIGLLLMLYKGLLEFHAVLVGGSLNKEPDGRLETNMTGGGGGGSSTDLTLRQCALELKYLIDTLNDRTETLNHMLSFVIPTLVFLYVLPLFLPGADPAADDLPVSVLTFGITLFYGMIAALLLAPIRWVAHKRLTKYRFWLRSVDRLLIDRADL